MRVLYSTRNAALPGEAADLAGMEYCITGGKTGPAGNDATLGPGQYQHYPQGAVALQSGSKPPALQTAIHAFLSGGDAITVFAGALDLVHFAVRAPE